MLKEKELSTLNTILTQERKVMLDKEEEIKKLRECLENQVSNEVPINYLRTFYILSIKCYRPRTIMAI